MRQLKAQTRLKVFIYLVLRSNHYFKDLKIYANNLKQTASNLEDEINFIDDQAVRKRNYILHFL